MRAKADAKANTSKTRETGAVSQHRSLAACSFLFKRRIVPSNSVSSIRLYRKEAQGISDRWGQKTDRTTFFHVLSAFPSGAIIDKSGHW